MTVENKVAIIEKLFEMGYREKVVKMITGFNQSYINKIKNKKLHKKDKVELPNSILELLDEKQTKRLEAANKILLCKEITSNDLEEDIKYIQLLRFFLIEKENIYNLYIHWTKSKINRYMTKKGVEILNFDSTLLDIEREVYLDLIIDYFIEG